MPADQVRVLHAINQYLLEIPTLSISTFLMGRNFLGRRGRLRGRRVKFGSLNNASHFREIKKSSFFARTSHFTTGVHRRDKLWHLIRGFDSNHNLNQSCRVSPILNILLNLSAVLSLYKSQDMNFLGVQLQKRCKYFVQ